MTEELKEQQEIKLRVSPDDASTDEAASDASTTPESNPPLETEPSGTALDGSPVIETSSGPSGSTTSDGSLGEKRADALPSLGSDYEVLECVGQGGMGSVYKVRNRHTDSVMAIKVLKNDLTANATAMKRFEQESKSLCDLDHLNLVAMYGHGQTENSAPYLVMDYVDGKSLAEILQVEKTIDETRAISMFVQICDGLSHAHKKGIVHRDIKPSNIVVSQNKENSDQVKILDFGIAKILESTAGNTTNLTQTGDVFGTPTYMSPEQCNGKPADARSDVYSLGCVMYEVLTGKPPFQGNSPIQVALKHINEEPVGFDKKRTEPRKSLEAIVMRCLAKDEEMRYQSVEDLAADLKRVATGGRIKRRALRKGSDKRPILLTAAGYCALLVFILFCITFVMVCTGTGFSALQSDDVGLSHYFLVVSFLLGATFTAIATLDYSRYTVKTLTVDRFWDLMETSCWATAGWACFALFGIVPLSGGNVLPFQLLCSSFAILFIISLAGSLIAGLLSTAFSSAKTLAKMEKPFLPGSAVKHGVISIGLACLALLTAFTVFPKPMSWVPYSYATFLEIPAPKLASVLLQEAIRLNPTSSTAYTMKANVDYKIDRNSDFLDSLNKAIAAYPESRELWQARGDIYKRLKRPNPALSDFSKALELEPKNEEIRSLKAEISTEQGDYAKAEQEYTTLIGMDQSNASYYRKRGLVYAAMNSFALRPSREVMSDIDRSLAEKYNYERSMQDFSKALIAGNDPIERERDLVRIGIIYELNGYGQNSEEKFSLAAKGPCQSDPVTKCYAYKRLGNDTYKYYYDQAMKLLPESERNEEGVRKLLTKSLFGEVSDRDLWVPW